MSRSGRMTARFRKMLAPVVLMAACTLTATALADCDPKVGEKIYNKCRACHSLEPGVQLMGPSLHNVMGRPAGTEAGFGYSLPMEKSGLVWDNATLDAFLESPMTYLSGTSMPFAGLKSAEQRAALLCFLESQTN